MKLITTLLTPNTIIILIIIVSIFVVIYNAYPIFKNMLPPKPPEHDEEKVNKEICDKIYRMQNRGHHHD